MTKFLYPESFHLDEAGVWVGPNIKPLRYNDGDDVENRLLEQVLMAKDLSVLSPELRQLAVDWPTMYHLSSRRANLLRPLYFPPGARILEIGAGCGAVTRYLGEIGAHVVGLEGSYRRAAIAAARTRDLPNVEVVASPLEDVSFTENFDAVVLVGVLEYAAMFDSKGPHEAQERLLRRCGQILAPSGLLLIAIENRIGVKYLAGAPEDHTGQAYLGVDDGYEETGPRTFTFQELACLIKAAGLTSTELLTPLPDYKLVRSVVRFSKAPPSARHSLAQIVASSFSEDPQHRHVPPFSLEQLGIATAVGGLADVLANSFLVLAARGHDVFSSVMPRQAFAWYYATERHPSFAKVTILERHADEIRACRYALRPSATPPGDNRLTQHLADEPFYYGGSVWLQLVAAVSRPGWSVEVAAGSLRDWYGLLSANSFLVASVRFVPGDLVDLTPFNTVVDGDRVGVFDLEWKWYENIPLRWVALRAILFSLQMITSFAQPDDEVLRHVGELTAQIYSAMPFSDPNELREQSSTASFLDWLAALQGLAEGRATEIARTQLGRLWEAEIPIRDRRPKVNLLEGF